MMSLGDSKPVRIRGYNHGLSEGIQQTSKQNSSIGHSIPDRKFLNLIQMASCGGKEKAKLDTNILNRVSKNFKKTKKLNTCTNTAIRLSYTNKQQIKKLIQHLSLQQKKAFEQRNEFQTKNYEKILGAIKQCDSKSINLSENQSSQLYQIPFANIALKKIRNNRNLGGVEITTRKSKLSEYMSLNSMSKRISTKSSEKGWKFKDYKFPTVLPQEHSNSVITADVKRSKSCGKPCLEVKDIYQIFGLKSSSSSKETIDLPFVDEEIKQKKIFRVHKKSKSSEKAKNFTLYQTFTEAPIINVLKPKSSELRKALKNTPKWKSSVSRTLQNSPMILPLENPELALTTRGFVDFKTKLKRKYKKGEFFAKFC
ncbi:unnamed protein product [Moneuplotes crassus]|uniref:Uncharacterized protein n=1 Tax=Euplotes crassus TaxID=5936 RepID=A0AAD1XAJ2_EUPCR|nr:unnamed protein product [Moneuplotes crassus]